MHVVVYSMGLKNKKIAKVEGNSIRYIVKYIYIVRGIFCENVTIDGGGVVKLLGEIQMTSRRCELLSWILNSIRPESGVSPLHVIRLTTIYMYIYWQKVIYDISKWNSYTNVKNKNPT